MQCPNCNYTVAESDTHCFHCGFSLKSSKDPSGYVVVCVRDNAYVQATLLCMTRKDAIDKYNRFPSPSYNIGDITYVAHVVLYKPGFLARIFGAVQGWRVKEAWKLVWSDRSGWVADQQVVGVVNFVYFASYVK